GGRTPLDRFREAFVERYEERSVPLVEVLDEESGIGFDPASEIEAAASPLLEGLVLPPPAEDDRTNRAGRLASLAFPARDAHPAVLELEDADIKALGGDSEPPPLPDAFAALATVVAPSAAAVDAGDFRLLVEMADGPSGARLLGRFCHGDPELRALVESHL